MGHTVKQGLKFLLESSLQDFHTLGRGMFEIEKSYTITQKVHYIQRLYQVKLNV